VQVGVISALPPNNFSAKTVSQLTTEWELNVTALLADD
jgi:hypothetical protein